MKKPPLYPFYEISTLRDSIHKAVSRYGEKSALQTKVEGSYRSTNYRELGEGIRRLATAYLGRGLGKGDRVGVLGENRTEWAMSYLAAVCAGCVVVPIDKDLKPREIRHILEYSGTSLLICSTKLIGDFCEPGRRPPGLKTVVSMEEEHRDADLSFAELLQSGAEALAAGNTSYDDAEIAPSDLAAIIFTSGTTGSSKAVALTHSNLAANIVSTSQMVSISQGDVLLSVLPLHHTYECTCGFLTALYQGATIYYAENLRRIPDNMVEAGATVMLGVPLLFETIYRRIEKGIQEAGKRKFTLIKGVASLIHRTVRINIRRVVFRSLHKKFGGRLRLLISGGAAINPAVARGYRDLGINFIQGYGMTEASPLISVNRENCCKDSSVGLPIPGVEVKFEDGEILVRGPNVMQGYYLNEAATAEVLREGWLHTGDLGHLDGDGFLYISGRKKSLIVTPNGKNVYPEELEKILNESPFILESLVWGGADPDPGNVEVQAIIVPSTEAFDQEFGASEYDDAKIDEIIGREVRASNQLIANYKRIKKYTIRRDEFEKTTTRKIKRYLYTAKPRPLQVGS